MPSTHSYLDTELPAAYYPGGTNWMAWRLAQSYTAAKSWVDFSTGLYYLEVGEENVSKNQLLFDVTPQSGELACNVTDINVPPMTTTMVTVTGPIGTAVKVRFPGVSFVSETEFTIPGNGNYEFQLGACPAGQRVVTPQTFEFYVEDGSCSPVAIPVTFS